MRKAKPKYKKIVLGVILIRVYLKRYLEEEDLV